jgi:hypothetical protein
MNRKQTFAILLVLFVGVSTAQEVSSEPSPTYGDFSVSKVLRLDEHVRIYCDIPELPPIIGQNIPVCINGLAPSKNPQDNLKLLMFLNELFLSNKNKPEIILLKDIQRGQEFCLVANVEVDGKDLCELLIEKKLARKIIQVPESSNSKSARNSAARSQTARVAASGTGVENANFIASRTSKIYHRATCPHVKRMDPSKAIPFRTRAEAEKTGRRPCKTCKP